MPYFNHFMAHSINHSLKSSKSYKPPSSGAMSVPASGSRIVRSMPGKTHKDEHIYRHADPTISSKYKQLMTQRKMLFMRSLLRTQVSQLLECMSTFPVDGNRTLFRSYKITNSLLHDSPNVKIFEARCQQSPSTSLSVRVYSKKESDSLHLKILRHLGRKHPYIIQTWELFCDNRKVYVFQEWAALGNLVEYMEQSPPLTEPQAAFWTKQVYRALDFLGDQGIAHRDLSPVHLVVHQQHGNEVWLKLTGFKQAIIYWDIKSNDVQFCPCWPLERQESDGPNFQPPEVYGDPEKEQFDPILADIWSFGACIYFMLAKQYPYNVVNPYENIDEEIWYNIHRASLSDDCKSFLFSLLRANANDRMPVDFIEGHPWVRDNSTMGVQKVNATSKHQVTGKSAKLAKPPPMAANEKTGYKTQVLAKNTGSHSCCSKGKSKGNGKGGKRKIMRCWCKADASLGRAGSAAFKCASGMSTKCTDLGNSSNCACEESSDKSTAPSTASDGHSGSKKG